MTDMSALNELFTAAEAFATQQPVRDPLGVGDIDPWQDNANRLRRAALAYSEAIRGGAG